MAKRPARPHDANELAKLIVDLATGEAQDSDEPDPAKRRAGQLGAKARASKLTPEQRSAIGRKAAAARWAKGE